MLSKVIKGLVCAGAVIAVGLLGLNLYIALRPLPKPSLDRPLAQILPTAPWGWSTQDLPMADSPEGMAQVNSLLDFDDAVFRVYQRGDTQVGVYVAYWKPGKASPAKVGVHTPDSCWIVAGWQRDARERGVHREINGHALKPLEYGEYEKDGQHLQVIFWQLVGGEPVNYDIYGWENGFAGRMQRWPYTWDDIRKYGLDQRKEQLFIRVSMNVPLAELWKDPDFAQLLGQLSERLKLYAPANAAG
jgi:hypothetical protein